ncbi:MAG: glycosyltransferase family 4 protein [Desulfovibrio sp.]|nr:glycosyltransferase family 4 protein [Desulfovibrio sp.]
MDACDYLEQGSLQTIYEVMLQGYDLGVFALNWHKRFLRPAIDLRYRALGYGTVNEKSYHLSKKGHDVQNLLNARLHSYVCTRDLCVNVFNDLPDNNFSQMEDALEACMLKLGSKSINIDKRKIYAVREIERNNEDLLTEMAFPVLKGYMESHGHNEDLKDVMSNFVSAMIPAWLDLHSGDNIRKLFDCLVQQFGIYEILNYLMDHHGKDWELIASQFQHYGSIAATIQPKRIGILYTMLGNGGAERVILELVKLLDAAGYEVILFLGRPNENEKELPNHVKRIYVGAQDETQKQFKEHLKTLGMSLEQHPVDVMLCHAVYFGDLLWQIMLIKYMKIPAIIFVHGSFFNKLVAPPTKFDMQTQAAILRCADKVSVLSPYEELYYRTLGVDAVYIPNPVRLPGIDEHINTDFDNRKDNIIVFGRMQESSKNMTDCLLILREVAKYRKSIKMTFIGSFTQNYIKTDFENRARKLGVLDRISITGWVNDSHKYIDASAILLSCAYTESFSLTIVEAQSRGLPVIMYDMPIAPAINNKSIIKIRHGAIKDAARNILSILEDEVKWHTLSQIAKENSLKFSSLEYLNKIINLLNNYNKYSIVSDPSPETYTTIMKTLGFYGATVPPWLRK